MKRILPLFLPIMLCSCVAHNRAVFTEASNYNILSMGSAHLKIDRSFQLVGDIENQLLTDNIDDRQGTTWNQTRYLFLDTSSGKENIQRIIIVFDMSMVKNSHILMGEASYSGFKGSFIERGMTDKLGLRCAYLCQKSTGKMPDDLMDLAKSKGYAVPPRSGVMVNFAKHIGQSRRIVVVYAEGGLSKADAAMENAAKFIQLNS